MKSGTLECEVAIKVLKNILANSWRPLAYIEAKDFGQNLKI